MTTSCRLALHRFLTLALVALALAAVPAHGQGLNSPDESALRALSAVALKALQPLVQRADAADRKTLGETENSADVFEQYLVSAEQGDGDAQTTLGLLYGKGLGVARDLIAAHKWFSIASDQDAENAAIYRNLVAKLMSPTEVSKAKVLAREWQEKQVN